MLKKIPQKILLRLCAVIVSFLYTFPAFADGKAVEWQLNFQDPASPVMEKLNSFHNLLLVIIIGITILVLLLLSYTCWRFRKKANPKASTTTHHTLLEVLWTTIPVLILVVIAVPSFKLLYYMDKAQDPEMTIKATGYQWYWGYEYPDYDNISFESYLVQDKDLAPGDVRLLSTDNDIVLPVNTTIRVVITSADVIHSWAVPSLGVKTDAVPGRLNETWIRIEKEGSYYGQCSELCGVGHGFMPIEIKAVSKEAFKKWVKKAKKQFGANKSPIATAELKVK